MPNKSITIAIICGGLSPEADVSRLSASRITPPLEKHYGKVIHLELDSTLPAELLRHKVDIAFPVAHGPYGEDGRLQGLLDIMGVPYVGSGVTASACSLDKIVTKRVLAKAGIPMAKDRVVYRNEHIEEATLECIEQLGPKVIIKPPCQGSGIGVQFALGYDDLKEKLEAGLKLDERLLVEEFIEGREITAGVLHLEDYTSLPVIEVKTPDNAWYDYLHRYTPGLSNHIIPAKLPKHQYQQVQNIALKAHKALNCLDLSRSDFLVPENGTPIFSELNNLPGMTPTSLYPDGAKHMGIQFEELLCSLINHAMTRFRKQANNGGYWPIPKLKL
ncbi:D-alanine--D-alanine ligase [Endozoicomonas sp. OPT23]|uniref:D-alanine--D-alanine ligase family protein n=1 Tax=Endozoicomonas sp. OPT23 TaxID=2072845 RepID=UPI00129BEE56|nr:D-alanine--D-alanine ligase [Endozoicomonas sp. OPT23]MRI32215.1 D-alanine--D-alanine ligase [Endozoicomonas sp. OPT23]